MTENPQESFASAARRNYWNHPSTSWFSTMLAVTLVIWMSNEDSAVRAIFIVKNLSFAQRRNRSDGGSEQRYSFLRTYTHIQSHFCSFFFSSGPHFAALSAQFVCWCCKHCVWNHVLVPVSAVASIVRKKDATVQTRWTSTRVWITLKDRSEGCAVYWKSLRRCPSRWSWRSWREWWGTRPPWWHDFRSAVMTSQSARSQEARLREWGGRVLWDGHAEENWTAHDEALRLLT